MKKLVYISWGHLGTLYRSKPTTGAKSPDETQWEVIEIGKYIQSMIKVLLEADVHVIIDTGGPIQKRQHRANEYAARFNRVAYVSCHLNAFPGRLTRQKAIFFYDKRSRGGKALAKTISRVDDRIPLSSTIPAVADDWTKNAFATVSGVYAGPSNISAVLCEPLAMNGVPRVTDEMLQGVGESIARGILAWLGEE